MDDVLSFVNMVDQDQLQVSDNFIYFILKKNLLILVVIAYLIEHQGHSLPSAYSYVLSIRPTISPNINYLNQLNQYSSQSE